MTAYGPMFLLSNQLVLIKSCCSHKFSPLTSVSCLAIGALLVLYEVFQVICTRSKDPERKGVLMFCPAWEYNYNYVNVVIIVNYNLFLS